MNIKKKFSQAFTILEMLVASAVLAMMSVLLFKSLFEITKVAENGMASIGIYQEARCLVDQMSRDLQQAIPYAAVVGGTTNDIFQASSNINTSLEFVSVIDNSSGHEEAEVHYVYDGTNGIYKALTFCPSNGSTSVDWDFSTNSSWTATPAFSTASSSKYALMLRGVKSVSYEFWATNGPTPSTGACTDTVWLTKGSELPAYVRVTIKAYDEKVVKRWFGSAANVPSNQTNLLRTYTFLVHLPRSQE